MAGKRATARSGPRIRFRQRMAEKWGRIASELYRLSSTIQLFEVNPNIAVTMGAVVGIRQKTREKKGLTMAACALLFIPSPLVACKMLSFIHLPTYHVLPSL
jgi:hypothetical protein